MWQLSNYCQLRNNINVLRSLGPRLHLVHGIDPITVEQDRDAVRWDRHRTITISYADRVGSLHREILGPLLGGVATLPVQRGAVLCVLF